MDKYNIIIKNMGTNIKSNIALIYHSADVDGLASGSLLEYVFRNLSNFGNKVKYDLIGYNYGTDTNENQWLTNQNYTEFYFVDCTPPIGWFEKNIDNLKHGKIRVNIFDHHKPIMEKVLELGYDKYLNYFFNADMCGALIFYTTFKEFFMSVHDIDLSIIFNEMNQKQIYEKLVLISAYDTWEFDKWPDRKKILGCIGFTEYLFMSTHNLKDFYNIFFETSFNQIFSGGMLLAEYNLGLAEKALKSGVYSITEKVFVLNGFGSWFITEKIRDAYPNCEKIIYFSYKLEKNQIEVKLSCRTCNQNKFDCVKYLNSHCDLNSGGHFNAAGGSMTISTFHRYLNFVKFGVEEMLGL